MFTLAHWADCIYRDWRVGSARERAMATRLGEAGILALLREHESADSAEMFQDFAAAEAIYHRNLH